jgi:hypothetical protein
MDRSADLEVVTYGADVRMIGQNGAFNRMAWRFTQPPPDKAR